MKSNQVMVVLMVALASSTTLAVETGIFSNFKQEMESYDSRINDFCFTCEASSEWWQIADNFVLSIMNSSLKDKPPKDYFGDINDQKIQGIKVNFNDKGFIGFSYYGPRPVVENGHIYYNNNEMSISIRPLTEDRSLYYVGYYRLWYELPNAEGRILGLGTFRILEKNDKTGKYEISATQEESNFYRRIINPGKFKYIGGNQVPFCEWNPHFEKHENDPLVKFELLYIIGLSGSPLQNKMYVSWTYGPDKKLKAIQYRYNSYDSRYDPNVHISKEIRNGKPVTLD